MIRITLTADQLAALRHRILPFTGHTDDELRQVVVTVDAGGVTCSATDTVSAAQLIISAALPARHLGPRPSNCERAG